jgi:hypothetical protein
MTDQKQPPRDSFIEYLDREEKRLEEMGDFVIKHGLHHGEIEADTDDEETTDDNERNLPPTDPR